MIKAHPIARIKNSVGISYSPNIIDGNHGIQELYMKGIHNAMPAYGFAINPIQSKNLFNVSIYKNDFGDQHFLENEYDL